MTTFEQPEATPTIDNIVEDVNAIFEQMLELHKLETDADERPAYNSCTN